MLIVFSQLAQYSIIALNELCLLGSTSIFSKWKARSLDIVLRSTICVLGVFVQLLEAGQVPDGLSDEQDLEQK